MELRLSTVYRVYLMFDVNTGYKRRNWVEPIEYENIKVTIELDEDEIEF